MCGICCALGWSSDDTEQTDDKAPTDPVKQAKQRQWYHDEVIQRSRRLQHRGPDWGGCHVDDECVLSHERLAIVGVDSGAQPLYSTSGKQILAVNGEIYNERQLKKDHCGVTTADSGAATQCVTTAHSGAATPYAFQTASDCEVLLPLYLLHRRDMSGFLNKLNGIFAFVLVDKDYEVAVSAELDAKSTETMLTKKITRWVAARDHLGIVPLYIGRDKNGACWLASELKALWDICVTFQEFPPGHWFDSLSETFQQWYAPAWFDPKTPALLSREHKTASTCIVAASLTPAVLTPAVSPVVDMPSLGDAKPTPAEVIDFCRLRTELEAAVKRQMMCDVPYGALLSGGLDSSIIASIAARFCKKRIEDVKGEAPAHWPVLHTFCVGLEGSPDLAAADEMAIYLKERYGTIHHRVVFTVAEGLAALEGTVYHLETSNVTTIRAGTPMRLMARRIKTLGIKMVLSGEGADEIFGGYLYFHKAPNAEELQKELVSKVRGLSKFDCLRANKAMAAWGVEARVPFLDRDFLDYAMSLSPSDKLCGRAACGRIEKAILRDAFRDSLPQSISKRQKEQFSDGCGYNWIDSIKKHAAGVVSDALLANAKKMFPYDTPVTKEGYLFRCMFARHFPTECAAKTVPEGPSVACSTAAALAWDASFREFADCSGRSIKGVHVAEYSETQRAVTT